MQLASLNCNRNLLQLISDSTASKVFYFLQNVTYKPENKVRNPTSNFNLLFFFSYVRPSLESEKLEKSGVKWLGIEDSKLSVIYCKKILKNIRQRHWVSVVRYLCIVLATLNQTFSWFFVKKLCSMLNFQQPHPVKFWFEKPKIQFYVCNCFSAVSTEIKTLAGHWFWNFCGLKT